MVLVGELHGHEIQMKFHQNNVFVSARCTLRIVDH
jgi:hypothetical protein